MLDLSDGRTFPDADLSDDPTLPLMWIRALLLAMVALCSLLARPQPARAFFFGGGREKKVPMSVVVADYSLRLVLPLLGPSPSA